MYNIILLSSKEGRWPQTLYIYILDITVRRHNNRTIVNFEPKFNWQ
jgi:hypothetical protein